MSNIKDCQSCKDPCFNFEETGICPAENPPRDASFRRRASSKAKSAEIKSVSIKLTKLTAETEEPKNSGHKDIFTDAARTNSYHNKLLARHDKKQKK